MSLPEQIWQPPGDYPGVALRQRTNEASSRAATLELVKPWLPESLEQLAARLFSVAADQEPPKGPSQAFS